MRKRHQINLPSFGKLGSHVGVFCACTPGGRSHEKCLSLATPCGHSIICICLNQGFCIHHFCHLQTSNKTPCCPMLDWEMTQNIWCLKICWISYDPKIIFSLHCWWQGAGYYFPPAEKTKQKARSNLFLRAGRTCLIFAASLLLISLLVQQIKYVQLCRLQKKDWEWAWYLA